MFAPQWEHALLQAGRRQRRRATALPPSELMTIIIAVHQSHDRTFKASSTEPVQRHWQAEFPGLVSSPRVVTLLPTILVPLTASLQTPLGPCTGLNFLDSTKLAVCHNARIGRHRVLVGRAKRGKTSVGWFFGFKRHLVVNDRGELLAFCLTPGTVDDRRPVPKLTQRLFGQLFGDRGSISQPLAEQLFVEPGLQLITKLRKNMHERLIAWSDTVFLRKRAIIESVVDQLKNVSPIEHARHRRPSNFLVNLVAGLVASSHQPKKPSLGLFADALPPA